MSYDLLFHSRNSEQRISLEQVHNYFAGRANYNVSDQQAIYENEYTGVYFIVDMGDPFSGDDLPETGHDYVWVPAALNVNYLRPHVFGLEAEIEISAFVKHFDLLVYDFQSEETGNSEYSREDFLQAYGYGNMMSYGAYLKEPEIAGKAHFLTTEKLESTWRWNYDAKRFNDELGPDIYVSRINYLDVDGAIRTAVMWADGVPSILPDVEIIILYRDRFLPRRWFRKREKLVFVRHEETKPFIERFPRKEEILPYYHLDYQEVPTDIQKFFRKAESTVAGHRGIVSPDQVLNQDFLVRINAT